MDNFGIKLYNIDQIGILEINSPPDNLIKNPCIIKITELENFISSNNIKGLIIKGAGRHFSSGADINELKKLCKSPENLYSQITEGVELLNYINKIEIPVISSIEGICFGGGFEIALSSHIRVCSEKSLFAFPEANINLIPGLGGTTRLMRFFNESEALFLLLSGDTFDAEKAIKYKIVNHITPSKETFDFSLTLMRKMTDGKPIKVINYIIRSINNYFSLPQNDALKAETKLFCELAIDEYNRAK